MIEDNERVSQLIKKCSEKGLSALNDAQAVELFLSLAKNRGYAPDIIEKLDEDEPFAIFEMSEDSLKKLGVSEEAAFLISIMPQLANRMSTGAVKPPKNQGGTPAEKQRRVLEHMIFTRYIGIGVERLLLILLNEKGRVLYSDFLRTGGNDNAHMDIELICSLASKHSAQYAIIAHNHPSGSSYPSAADCHATSLLFESLESVGVTLVDHYIVTRSGCASIKKVYNFSTKDEKMLNLIIAKMRDLEQKY